MNTLDPNSAPILNLPEELDALDELYEHASQRGDGVACWLIATKVRRCYRTWSSAESLFRWRDRLHLSYSSLTDEERTDHHARIPI